jgi:uncharacterized protein (DUF2062 family)
MIICQLDAMRVYTGKSRELDKDEMRLPIPANWVAVEPPTVPEGWYALWRGDSWLLSRDYPQPPPPPEPSTMVDRLTLVQMLAKTGKGETLGALLKGMSTADREEWYARQQVDLADPRIQAALQAVEIDLGQLTADHRR